MKSKITAFGLFLFLLCGCSPDGTKKLTVTVTNPSGQPRTAMPVVVDLKAHAEDMTVRTATVTWDETEIPSQLDDLDGDFRADELVFTADLPAQGEATFHILLSEQGIQKEYTAGTQAYIKLNDIKGKHPKVNTITYPGDADLLDMYNSIYGHGAVFENRYIAYRIYMDNRQSIDLYGKTTARLEMEATGFYTTPEQLAQGYGCDILWAGKSVGAGSFRGFQHEKPCTIDTVAWRRQTILASGPVRSIVEVTDAQWQYNGRPVDMTQRYTLYAGRRDVEADIHIKDALPNETFCTGILKLENQHTGFMQTDGLCGSWGNNVPEKGTPDHNEWVGLGLYAQPENRTGMKEDEFNYLTLLTPDASGHIRYRIAVCAEREQGGFKTAEEWFGFLHQWKAEADTPCNIQIQ